MDDISSHDWDMDMGSTSSKGGEQGYIFVTLLILLWGLILIFVGSQYSRESVYKVEILNSNLQQLNRHLADALDIVGSPDELYARNADRLEGLRLMLIDTTGMVFYDSHGIIQGWVQGADIDEAIMHGEGFIIENKASGRDCIYSSTYCDSLIVRSSLPYSITITEVLGGSQTFLFIAIIISLLISWIGYIASKLYSRLKHATIELKHQHAMREHEIQEKVRIKRQLTNNINHELKTPICSILGYLDMIINNPNITQEQMLTFAGKSYDQAERLRHLMSDLSTITRIDEASSMIECEDVNISILVDDIIDDVCPQAKQQSIAVINNLPDNIVIEGNNSLIYSIFRNLVDNAIAYSGGRSVWVELSDENMEQYAFVVRDNGIGIERGHLAYIFERFYRVDKGRSRKQGGTGLGLSIVKNAVLFHGGTIEASIAQKGGAEFHFTLQKRVADR